MISGANLLSAQRIANAPLVDELSFSQYELAGALTTERALGAMFPSAVFPETTRRALGGIPGTIYIANDITDRTVTVGGQSYFFTAFQIKQKAYVHELGNILAYVLTGDANYFGDPTGIGLATDPTRKDYDTGAALEKCVYRTPLLIP